MSTLYKDTINHKIENVYFSLIKENMTLSLSLITKRELQLIKAYSDQNCIITHNENNLRIWNVSITTDVDSTFGIKTYQLEVMLPDNYPFVPPVIRFMTPIELSCVNDKGYLFIDLLLNTWSPALGVASTVIAILSLLNQREQSFYDMKRQNQRVGMFCQELMERVWIRPQVEL
jgi:ubiquitin-protein ligase